MNSVCKGVPWYYPYFEDETRLDDFKLFGLNVIRLGTMWAGAEPTEGVYNETYIDVLQDIIEVRLILF